MQEIFICSNISISQQPRSLIHSLMCLKVDLLKPNSDKKNILPKKRNILHSENRFWTKKHITTGTVPNTKWITLKPAYRIIQRTKT